MAIDYFKGQMNALAGVTPDNYIEKRTALTKFEEQWKVVTASQKELYAECADAVAAVEADIAGCGLAKGVIDDIAALVAKTPLPATIETLREEYAALKVRYEGLAEKYKAQVTNGDDFTAYGELLDAYDPAQSVENAIEKLFVDYATINSSNKNEAKEALAAVLRGLRGTDGKPETGSFKLRKNGRIRRENRGVRAEPDRLFRSRGIRPGSG